MLYLFGGFSILKRRGTLIRVVRVIIIWRSLTPPSLAAFSKIGHHLENIDMLGS
jgi:hypothetical protein